MERFLPAVFFVFLLTGLTAQDSVITKDGMSKMKKFENDSTLAGISGKILLDTAVVTDTAFIKSNDSLIINDLVIPDENLNDIFQAKMDSLVDSWYINNMFQLDTTDSKELPDVYPTNIPDSVYIERLSQAEQVIDLSYNKVVDNFIKLYTEKRRDQVRIMLGLSSIYFPVFEEILDKYEMPLELKYLPVIESALNPKARSRAGATGLWQLMFHTARLLKMEITSFVDERRDPVLSTEAAVNYLRQLYDYYGNWHLAIAAYNCGPGNVDRAIRRSGNKNDYWKIYYFLPRETRGFVPAFIAASYVMTYYKEHNLMPRVPEIPLKSDTVMIHQYLHFDQVSATLNIKKEILRSLNPVYRRDVVPAMREKPYPLTLPDSRIMEFIDKDTMVFAYNREKYFPDNIMASPASFSSSNFTPVDIEGKAKIFYKVRQGDNVGFIAEWFHVRASDLRYWNNIRRNLIRAGDKLVVYVPEDQKKKYENINSMSFAQKQAVIGKTADRSDRIAMSEPLDPNYEYYTVKRGDTLWEIAKRYRGISAEEIQRLNNLSGRSKLSIGQKLKIRSKDI
jgi:membrane-bound lytic murein transglycosylase D